jgi:hypothetical protein
MILNVPLADLGSGLPIKQNPTEHLTYRELESLNGEAQLELL